VSQDGKLSVMGIFSQINAPQVPFVHPQAFLAFEVEFDYAEVGSEFNVEVQIVDEDGKRVWGMKGAGSVRTQTPPKPGDRPTIGQILLIQNLRFERFGSNDINVFTNGVHSRRIQLRVAKLASPIQQ